MFSSFRWFKQLLLSFILIQFSFIVFSQSKITLREHQNYPIQFLKERPDQKGLLVYHGLGTGKTFLSLGFTESFPKKKVVVLLPRFLKSNWEIQMKTYGVKDKSRYQLVSFRDVGPLLKEDFKNTIVIIDEVHKLIDLMTSSKGVSGHDYGKLYFKIRQAHKVLALTGTPIYNSSFDIAYIANLVSGKNLLTFNPEQFKEDYTAINTGSSLFRGHINESKLIISLLPLTVFITLVPFIAAGGVFAVIPPAGFFGSLMSIFVTNEVHPTNSIEFRRFDSEKLTKFMQQYISYHEIADENQEFYPDVSIHRKNSSYNEPQTHFFLDFVDEALDKESLKTLLLDDASKDVSDDYLALNSINLQKKFLQDPTVGREIGNLAIYSIPHPKIEGEVIYRAYRVDAMKRAPKRGKLIESAKFERIYETIMSEAGQVTIYSNYYSNGVLQFSHFLKRKRFNNFAILSPEDSVEKQIETINSYNSGKIRVLILHPEITEGVSLQATEQLHILEPLTNIALQEQVIGRAVRYNSHAKLPKNRRNVDVYLWKSEISYCHFWFLGCIAPTEAAFIKREHWQRRFSEVNPSGWTHGISFVDKNYMRKQTTPDYRVEKNSHIVESEMTAFKELVKQNSIESQKKDKQL